MLGRNEIYETKGSTTEARQEIYEWGQAALGNVQPQGGRRKEPLS